MVDGELITQAKFDEIVEADPPNTLTRAMIGVENAYPSCS
jgi:hypothetical protein